MKVKDLRLGDIVKCSDKGIPMYVVGLFREVAYLDFDGNEGDWWEVEEEDLKPISLTPEILEKNGIHFNEEFRSKNDKPQWVCMQKGRYFFLEKIGKRWRLEIRNYEGGFYTMKNFIGEIDYVHELQHLIHDCNIEKEIEL